MFCEFLKSFSIVDVKIIMLVTSACIVYRLGNMILAHGEELAKRNRLFRQLDNLNVHCYKFGEYVPTDALQTMVYAAYLVDLTGYTPLEKTFKSIIEDERENIIEESAKLEYADFAEVAVEVCNYYRAQFKKFEQFKDRIDMEDKIISNPFSSDESSNNKTIPIGNGLYGIFKRIINIAFEMQCDTILARYAYDTEIKKEKKKCPDNADSLNNVDSLNDDDSLNNVDSLNDDDSLNNVDSLNDD